MKILILQTKGKHKENVEFRESLCMQRALNRIDGVTAFVYGPGYPLYATPFDRLMKAMDCILLLENYSKKPWLPDLSKVNKLKLFWSIDAHVVLKRHKQIVGNNKINIVLNSTAFYVNHFKQRSNKSLWFPNCYPVDLIDKLNTVKQYDTGFCGNYVNRKKFLDQINKQCKIKKDIFIIGASMVKAINSYKIHINKNYSRDINYRTFETLGCETFLLTNETDKLKDLFTVNKHLVTYSSTNDAIEKIKYYLHFGKERNTIANEGYLHVRKNHTYDNRALQLIDIIKENI